MAGVKSHWNQNIADDPLGQAKEPGKVSTTSSAGDAAGPMRSAGAEKVGATRPATKPSFSTTLSIGTILGASGMSGRAIKEQIEKNDRPRSSNQIQGVNRKR